EGGVATIDLSAEFVDGYPSGGSAAEAAILGPLVYTATEFDGIDAVLLVVDGAPPAPVGSSYDLSQPLVRQDIPVSLAASP
ncbi:MAG: GerMN domain-containing protein, partial [Miltoncostaeaceae bacterium]